MQKNIWRMLPSNYTTSKTPQQHTRLLLSRRFSDEAGGTTSRCPQVRKDSLATFYQDSNILLSGGTGFLGKVILEKLLRSFHSISSIYVLVRPKKGADPQERIKEILDTPVSLPTSPLNSPRS